MGQEITGVHIFEKLGHIEWEDELIVIQALSALSWKKYHGRIELYCNEDHLESLKKWGVDKIYDKIDTDLLKKSPKNIDRKEFWTFCKLFVSSNLKPPFVLVDTDLWITSPLEFDFSNSFIAYHEESYDWSRPKNFYVDFDDFIPEKYLGYFDKNVKPTNVALLLWNDENLLADWYRIAKETLSENRNCTLDKNQKTIFLEQWLLPMNAVKTNKKYTTLIPQIYMNCNEMDDFTNADNMWNPPVHLWDEELWLIFNKIKHVWGLKKRFDENNIVEQVFEKVKNYFTELNFYDEKILNFVEKKSGIISGYNRDKNDNINILYCIPNILTDTQSNILYKRIEGIYKSNKNIIIHVCVVGEYNYLNFNLKNRIIDFIGSVNFISSKNNIEEIKKTVYKKNINIVQYDYSFYDNDFNNTMDVLFDEKDILTIKSDDGEHLFCNNGKSSFIRLDIQNKILDLLPDVGYDFDKNSLPIHIVYENRIKSRLDFNKKHIILLGDFKSCDYKDYISQLVKKFYDNNLNIEFHLLSHMDVNSDSYYINLLTSNCKIWMENLDFYDFIKVSDLVIDITEKPNSLINEIISYGIPILKSNSKYSYENFTFDFSFDLTKDYLFIDNIIQNKLTKEIPLLSNNFANDYCIFYTSIRSK